MIMNKVNKGTLLNTQMVMNKVNKETLLKLSNDNE